MVTSERVEPRVGIIGGGITGIITALFLREKLGVKNIIAIERNPEFGGTWFENSYPGLSCDIPAHLYSFSFAMNPNWSVPYPSRDELLKYIVDVVDKYEVRKMFRLNCAATRGVWDEKKGVWTVYYKDISKIKPISEEEKKASVLQFPDWVRASDPLSPQWAEFEALPEESFECEFLYNTQKPTGAPGLPDIPGAREHAFKGPVWHRIRWPTNGLDLVKGKRVALIGCAAAAVQLVPQLQPLASHVSVFHRTPNHVMHRDNHPYSEEQKEIWRKNPAELRKFRTEFEEKFFKVWINAAFVDGSPEQKFILEDSKANLYENIKDERLREILWPEFMPWGRRVTFHDKFYKSLTEPNVELVQDRIICINENGVLTALQNARDVVHDEKAPKLQRDFDVIIYGTGWAPQSGRKGVVPFTGRDHMDFGLSSMNIKLKPGENGAKPSLDLSEFGFWNYMGEMFEGFPNYFAPITPGAMTFISLIENAEKSVDWTLKILKYAIARNLKSIEVKREAIEWWTNRLDKAVEGAPCASGARNSYFKLYRPDGSFTARIWYPLSDSPRELEQLLLYPIYSHFDQTPKEDGAVKWAVPTPPEISLLDKAYEPLV
ncbi:FAD/NAD(P)-binding domain-containing protein [Gonapodya prolifera JEL478]|uniref:FAD/NAD(P)-binding domain-containing protein n=1 Tax=Gonapodya prolifera (strain JEL478) TaxID=1344416 RepID=A0A139A4C3_GONPJ|nr:FAD/NAD(P)-binding domain-containing protein [Gonapodya prolifera JEL478]|eukprot:KXS11325.1 FAD/NAD(P)-binding domain-containing protein [Gonapodya prolifera JEL478]